MNPSKKLARKAGFYYLLVVVFSVLYMEYIPSKIVVFNNEEETINNLISNELLFRTGILIGVLVHLSFILLPLTLYKLLSPVNKDHAVFMVVFALISIPFSYTLLLDQFDILELLKNYNQSNVHDTKEIGSKVINIFKRFYNGFFLAQVFWGLWLFPFGYLVFKSGFLPRVLGIFLMLGCITYLIDVFGGTIFSNYYDVVDTRILIIPATIGEVGICLWLLLIGVKKNIKF
ncbi:hypothetical protein ATO12_20425 [Aquimarina atlantica]|uniref:DUF4386 domain-containing protein n=1 Tax=Aquimarina atlantica TaxID=1317122 RepID=A0A023BTM7_9FLAO|nr:DUF4386 domain-containing protein [Aquimarina atlantica]EZH73367.1 hypothetical protein ATO12_20425 [Aquimarina atlantica]